MGNAGSGPASGVEVPEKMRAVMLQKFVEKHTGNAADYEGALGVHEIDTPKPRAGQVLVRMEASPINPSDLSMLTGTYNSKQREELPSRCGFEGVGEVVASGGGYGYFLLGKRVAIVSKGGGRMWAEYATANAMECIPLPEAGTGCGGVFVNPLTAIAFDEIARQGKHKAVVLTAAGSALGKMSIRLFARSGIKTVAVVRRAAQADELREVGAADVVVSTEEGWEKRLAETCKEHNARLCFDAVAGGLTGAVLHAMPAGSCVRVYGGLSLDHCSGITSSDLIFAKKSVRGFWLTDYLKSKSLMGLASWMKLVKSEIGGALATTVRKTYPMDQAGAAVADYNSNMAAGKICIGPWLTEVKDAAGEAPGAAEEKKEDEAEQAAE